MERIKTLSIAAIMGITPMAAQTSDIIFFSDDGERFTLIIDGDVKNEAPAARVVATDIRNESPVVMVRFETKEIPQLRKNVYIPLGMEYTIMITTNRKGERVLRPTGEAPLGTAAQSDPTPAPPAVFVDDAAPAKEAPQGQVGTTSGVHQTTTVVVTEGAEQPVGGEGVQMRMGVDGIGFGMDVRVTDGTTGTKSTTTTTTTTTTVIGGGVTQTMDMDTGFDADPIGAPTPAEEMYRMPGYTGPIGCGMPMSDGEFSDIRKSVSAKSFEDSRMTVAKQVGRERCFTAEQVKQMMGVFSFEDSRLDFAKFAYDRTHDIGNFYKVNEAFTFESSIEELNDYMESR